MTNAEQWWVIPYKLGHPAATAHWVHIRIDCAQLDSIDEALVDLCRAMVCPNHDLAGITTTTEMGARCTPVSGMGGDFGWCCFWALAPDPW